MVETIKQYLAEKEIDAAFINTHDEFLSEFTKRENNDLFHVTGFTGSNGYCLITKNKNLFFTDGRYTLQAKNEIPHSFEIYPIHAFFNVLIQEGITSILLHFEKVSERFIKKIHTLLPQLKFIHLDEKYSKPFKGSNRFYYVKDSLVGEKSKDKINKIQNYLKENNKDGFFIADAQSVCWVLNIRGEDETFTPIYKTTLFIGIDGYKIEPSLEGITGDIFVDDYITHKQYVQIPAGKTFNSLIADLKAIKNNSEINGMVNSHKIDGKAVTEFLKWFENNYHGLSEWDVSQKILEFRNKSRYFIMPSFQTICGVNSNGAIIHYNPRPDKCQKIKENSVVLIDSGGQYIDIHGKKEILGTTDITRTVFVGNGEPSSEYKKAFTLVLKGHIAVATTKFQKETPGKFFDDLARKFLKDHGMDYSHSTGHGVGAFLSVHEDGCSLSARNEDILKAGMIISNEPGYYLEGKFGIRIENLILVREDVQSLFFETITLVPIQEKSIDFNLLTDEEKFWVLEYNKRCMENLSLNI